MACLKFSIPGERQKQETDAGERLVRGHLPEVSPRTAPPAGQPDQPLPTWRQPSPPFPAGARPRGTPGRFWHPNNQPQQEDAGSRRCNPPLAPAPLSCSTGRPFPSPPELQSRPLCPSACWTFSSMCPRYCTKSVWPEAQQGKTLRRRGLQQSEDSLIQQPSEETAGQTSNAPPERLAAGVFMGCGIKKPGRWRAGSVGKGE